MTHYYVYYRVDPARLEELRRAVAQLLDAIERETGVRGRWLRRRDEPTTFMEVYEGVADGAAFEAVLERESTPLGLERHVERFICA
jgi:quinol monooxygenase YgiN